MPSPPHPRLRNRHSLPRALSNSADPSDSAARELWTAIPCDSLEYRRVVPTSESPTTQQLCEAGELLEDRMKFLALRRGARIHETPSPLAFFLSGLVSDHSVLSWVPTFES